MHISTFWRSAIAVVAALVLLSCGRTSLVTAAPDDGDTCQDCEVPLLGNGEICVTDSDCSSTHCECANESCSVTLCSAAVCNCGLNVDGDSSCDGFLPAGTDDARATCGASSCDGSGACLPWWNTAFLYRRQIIIDHTRVAADLDDFPVLIHFPVDADLAAHAQSDGDDIAFTSAVHDKLDHEIEAFDAITGELVAWVRVPLVSSTVDTVLYIYYGDATAPNQQVVGATWVSSYRGVWHMAGDLATPAPLQPDSTDNGNDGACRGAMTGSQRVVGQIGPSLRFDGVDDAVQVAYAASLDMPSMSVSAWIRKTAANVDHVMPVARQQGTDTADVFNLDYHFATDNPYTFCDGTLCATGPTSASDLDRWVYLVGTTDGVTISLYIDGVLADATPAGGPISSETSAVCIGGAANDATRDCTSEFVEGSIDEVRLADVVRSSEWIASEFANQSSPSTFYTVAQEESL